MIKIFNQTQKTLIADQAVRAETLSARMKGLLGRTALNAGEALIIVRCQSIHMFFMKFSIDAIFIDRSRCVVGLVEKIKPFQLSPYFYKAESVIECPAGTIRATQTGLGDQVCFEDHHGSHSQTSS